MNLTHLCQGNPKPIKVFLGSQPCQMNWISRVSETVTGSSNPWWWWWWHSFQNVV